MTEVRTTSSTGGQKGTKLARFDLIPVGPLRELAEHFGKGAAKYDDNQWRKGYEWSKSYAALQRHLNAFWDGEDYDVCPEGDDGCAFVDMDGNEFPTSYTEHGRTCFNHTGSHHMAAAAWHTFALLEFKDRFPQHDDRFKDGPSHDFDAVAQQILEDHPPTRQPGLSQRPEALKVEDLLEQPTPPRIEMHFTGEALTVEQHRQISEQINQHFNRPGGFQAPGYLKY